METPPLWHATIYMYCVAFLQIKQLLKEKTELEKKFSSKGQNVVQLEGRLQQAQKDKSTLQAKVAALDKEVGSLKKSNDMLKVKVGLLEYCKAREVRRNFKRVIPNKCIVFLLEPYSTVVHTVFYLIRSQGALARSDLISWGCSLGSGLSNGGFELKIGQLLRNLC